VSRDTDVDAERDDTARISAVAAAVLGACFTVGGFALGGPRAGLSVAVGAAIAVANLLTMRAIIGALLTPDDDENAEADEAGGVAADPVAEAEAEGAAQAARDPSGEAPLDGQASAGAADAASKKHGRHGGAAWGVFALLKILVLFGGIGLLLMRGWVQAIPLVIGYGVLPLGITASTLLTSLRPRRPGSRRKR
jgi:hypothetical protein